MYCSIRSVFLTRVDAVSWCSICFELVGCCLSSIFHLHACIDAVVHHFNTVCVIQSCVFHEFPWSLCVLMVSSFVQSATNIINGYKICSFPLMPGGSKFDKGYFGPKAMNIPYDCSSFPVWFHVLFFINPNRYISSSHHIFLRMLADFLRDRLSRKCRRSTHVGSRNVGPNLIPGLVMTNSSLLKMTIEIVHLRSLNRFKHGDFPVRHVNVYQRVAWSVNSQYPALKKT